MIMRLFLKGSPGTLACGPEAWSSRRRERAGACRDKSHASCTARHPSADRSLKEGSTGAGGSLDGCERLGGCGDAASTGGSGTKTRSCWVGWPLDGRAAAVRVDGRVGRGWAGCRGWFGLSLGLAGPVLGEWGVGRTVVAQRYALGCGVRRGNRGTVQRKRS